MPGPLLIRTDPIVGESLMSLVTRAAVRNLLPSSHAILEQVGAPHAQNPTVALVPDLDEERLAAILRIPVAEVAARRHAAAPGELRVDFFGAAVRTDEIAFRRRRFAPAAIGRSAHARALWSLQQVPCCTETWQYLIETCSCGAVQGWRHAWSLHRCDRCCLRLDRVAGRDVDPEHRKGLGFVVGLLDPDAERRAASRDALPPALADWNGGDVFELALALMPLTSDGTVPRRRGPPPPGDEERHAAGLAQAADLVRSWPSSLVPALEAAVARRSLSRVNVRYVGIAEYLPGLTSEVLPHRVRDALEGALAPIRAAPGHTPPGQIGMMAAVDLLGRDLRTLAPARRAGQLRTRVCLRANRLFPTLDLEEVEHVRDFAANRRSAEGVSDALDLPRYAMTQLADEGLIALEPHPFLVAHYGEPQIHAKEAERFRLALRHAARPQDEIADPIPLHRVARAIGGGPKPWGSIVRDLLSGATPFCMSGDRFARISVPAEHARSILSSGLAGVGFPPAAARCSQRDAVEVLNLPLKHSHFLRDLIDVDDDWNMAWADVLRLAAARVTLTELAARTRIHPNRLLVLMDAAGCPRLDRFGWCREQAMAALG